jgi:hypothetical protein
MSPFLNRTRHHEMMPVEHDMQQMWQLTADRRSVRLSLPSQPVDESVLRLAGRAWRCAKPAGGPR